MIERRVITIARMSLSVFDVKKLAENRLILLTLLAPQRKAVTVKTVLKNFTIQLRIQVRKS